ncbi:MAG: DUF4296 domain-containing protein [Salinivirgaceae bacterium]|nr:DUF4296 domain-containing protein [Salinivirgaceae bacterium]
MKMLRSCLLVLMLALAVQSCSHNDGDRPEIKRDKLVDVLVDIHLTEGYLSYSGSRIDRNRDRIEGAYGYVLRKYDITPKQFDNTMKYYSDHLSDYEQLYNKVIERLTKMETENLSSPENPQRTDIPKKDKIDKLKKKAEKK